MWDISTSTNNTHWPAIIHSRCRDPVSPKNQAYSPQLHESHCPGITCALQAPTLIMNCNCTLFFYMWYHILKRKKDVVLIMWYTELTLLLLYIQNPLKRNASKTQPERNQKLWSAYQTSHNKLVTIKFTLITLCFTVSDWTFLSHKNLPPHLLFYLHILVVLKQTRQIKEHKIKGTLMGECSTTLSISARSNTDSYLCLLCSFR